MADRFAKRNLLLLASCVAGSLLMNAQGAAANSEFREFRDDNPGIDRHQLRQLFRQQTRVERAEQRASLTEHRLANISQPPSIQTSEIGKNNFDRRITNQIERGNTFEIGVNSRLLKENSGLNFDLTSADRNIVLGEKLLGSDSIDITVGGITKTVTSKAHFWRILEESSLPRLAALWRCTSA